MTAELFEEEKSQLTYQIRRTEAISGTVVAGEVAPIQNLCVFVEKNDRKWWLELIENEREIFWKINAKLN